MGRPSGTLVDVKFEMNTLGGITTDRLLMTNLSTWQGLSNPTRAGSGLWLDMNLHRDSPFVAEGAYPGCVLSTTGASSPLTLAFELKSDPSVKTPPVVNGAKAKLTVPCGPMQGDYVVYNADAAAGYEEIPGYEHTWIRWAP